MKSVLVCLFVVILSSYASANCHTTLRCYESQVNELLNRQIKVELKGQYTYLYLSYVFMRNDLYYPRAAKYFREKANEELQHAERFIEYQNQRGGKFDIGNVKRKNDSHCGNIRSLKDGFSCARQLEISVTNALTKLLSDVSNVQPLPIIECEDIDDARRDLVLAQPIIVSHRVNSGIKREHLTALDCSEELDLVTVEYVELAEMITHEFLGHQIEDTKELANFEATLAGFTRDEKLGSFLADKHFDL